MLSLGIFFALLSAVTANLGFLYKYRGANEKPAIDIRRPIQTGLDLWKSKAFAAGMMIGLVGFVCQALSLALAPMSIVQVVSAGGIVLVAVLADRLFGIAVGSRQWLGLFLTGVGMILLVIAVPGNTGAHSSFKLPQLTTFEGILAALAVLLTVCGHLPANSRRHGILLAAAAGAYFGLCNVAVKATAGVITAGGSPFTTPWFYIAIIGSAAGYFISAKSLQEGGAVEVIAITTAVANVIGIVAGLAVFGDPFANSTLGVVAQVGGFMLVILAGALLPAPDLVAHPERHQDASEDFASHPLESVASKARGKLLHHDS